jgi:hypothetical protein
MGKPLGGWGSVVDIPFLLVTRQSRFGNVGCARLVVPVPVMLAWCERSWCFLPVVPGVIVCSTWF